MHTESDYLRSIAEEIVATKNERDLHYQDKHLFIETKRLENIITANLYASDNYTRRETYFYDSLAKLVEICDMLFDIDSGMNPNVQVLLNLLDSIRRVIPSEISPKQKLPKAFIYLQRPLIEKRWVEHQQILKSQQIDTHLIDIAAIPFLNFISTKHKLHWRDFTWLKGYQEQLENIDWQHADCNSSSEALLSVLIGADFNDDRFFIYCKKYIRERISHHATKKRRLAELAECEKLILQDTQNELPSYNHRRHNITIKLINWIKKESDAIKSNETFEEDVYKIEFNWDVDTIALFWKYLMEHGITKLVPVDVYAKQIAATCSSKGKVEFKWETIKGRFYGKKQTYLKKIYTPLTSIIEDIRRFLR